MVEEDPYISSLKLRFAEIQEKIKNFKVCLDGIEISSAIIKEVRTSRETLHQFFSQSSYQKLCSNCHGDHCCMNDYGQYLLSDELIYFAVIGYDLPTPDWKFLAKEAYWGRLWCLFLGTSGCLFKENRRVICLRYYCRELFRKIKEEPNVQFVQFDQFDRNLKAATTGFAKEVLEKLGLRLDEGTRLSLQYLIKSSEGLFTSRK